MKLKGYCDASYANLENYASLSGHVFILGDTAIAWSASRQPVIATSTSESEYIALLPCLQECLWIKRLLNELGYKQRTVQIFEDNEACIALAKNPQNHKRTRHIQVRYHWIRDVVRNGEVSLTPIKTDQQLADIFTKGTLGPRLRSIRAKLGLQEVSSQEESWKLDFSTPSSAKLRMDKLTSTRLLNNAEIDNVSERHQEPMSK